MGRKGVSKRKPKKSEALSSERSSVTALVKDKGAPINRDGMNPPTGTNKTQKKR
jgi:hypothetical protein